jgi:lipopolysaccharide heptosyltransferase II
LTAIGKILVVRLSSIGDIILTTPLLRSLRAAYPEARITFLIKKQFEELLSASPFVDELITFDTKEGFESLRKIKHFLREQRYDLYLDIHKNWRSRYLRFCLHAGKITSYRKLILKRTLLIWFKINLYKQIKPVYQRYFDSVRHLGIHYDGLGTEIHLPADRSEKIRMMLSEAGYDFDGPLITLCPSATYFNKRWGSEGFVETARHLIREKSAFIVVLGGKEDTELCVSIASDIGPRATSMAGLLSLSGSAALLHSSTMIIANDSGLLHMAQSQKRPVVGIYGATTRELGYFPIEQNSTVIETSLPCRPCTHNGLDECPKKHFRCMKDIPASKVIEAAMQYLP